MRAVDLFEQGVIPAEIARRLGVGHQKVSDWRTVWRQAGRDGLRAAGRAGRLPKLGREHLAQVEAVLANGPEANRYTTDLWTLARVAEVSERVSGVSYHPRHRVAHPARAVGLELATTGSACGRTQRRSH